jgi:hypothetical protein
VGSQRLLKTSGLYFSHTQSHTLFFFFTLHWMDLITELSLLRQFTVIAKQSVNRVG